LITKVIPKLFKSKARWFRAFVVKQFIWLKSKKNDVSSLNSVIIAPHPDDEVLGCGGIIAIKTREQLKVSVIFLTDGENSHKICCSLSSNLVGDKRRKHSIEALSILGVKARDIYRIGLRDGSIPTGSNEKEFQNAVEKLATKLNKIDVDEIYIPHPLDRMPDHEAASRIAEKAISRINKKCELFYYPVWMWTELQFVLLPKLMTYEVLSFNIQNVLQDKINAIEAYLKEQVEGCGCPYCGDLQKDGFINSYKKPYEIFFRQARLK